MLKKNAYYIAVLYTLGLAFVSLISLRELPKPDIESGDKLFHFFAYFVLTLLWFNAFSSKEKWKRKQTILKASVFSFVFGIIIELLQSTFTSTRASDVYDVLANTLGILLAVLAIRLFKLKDVKNF